MRGIVVIEQDRLGARVSLQPGQRGICVVIPKLIVMGSPSDSKREKKSKMVCSSCQRMDFLHPVDPPLLLTPVGYSRCGMLH